MTTKQRMKAEPSKRKQTTGDRERKKQKQARGSGKGGRGRERYLTRGAVIAAVIAASIATVMALLLAAEEGVAGPHAGVAGQVYGVIRLAFRGNASGEGGGG